LPESEQAEHQEQYRIIQSELQREWSEYQSTRLLKQADALHIEHPPRQEELGVGFVPTGLWELERDLNTFGYRHLSRAGCSWLRQKIREERKGRWEDGTRRYVLLLTAMTFAVSAWNAYASWTKDHAVTPRVSSAPTSQVVSH